MSTPRPKTPAAPLALAANEERSLKYFSDDVITSHIYTKHSDDEAMKIDLNNYISFIENVVKTADQIAETHLGRVQGSKGHFVFSDDPLKYPSSIDPPLCTLHQISKELACKAPGIETAHKTTLDILNKLISYPWEAKAALTFAAFATDYGVIWHLDHYSHSDPLAKSLAKIKRVAWLKKELESFKYRHVNSLIYSCLQAIKNINELKNISKYDTKEVPELSAALRQIPLVSYWIIHTLVASSTELHSYLSGAEGQTLKYLNELDEKFRSLLFTFEKQLQFIREQQEEVELYKSLVGQTDHFPTDVTLFLSKLIDGKHKPQPLINCSTQLEEHIEEFLKEKNLILVVSKGLKFSMEDLEILHVIYDELKRENKYEIVWVPVISDPPNEGDEEAYESLKSKMKWYALPFTTKVAGVRFLEEKWQLREDLMVVVLDSKSKIEFTNAVHLTRVWKREAIPFTYERAKALLRKNWIDSTVVKFSDQPRLRSWINQERNIIFYGGHNPNWVRKFEETAEAIKRDPLAREEGATFEMVPIGRNDKGEHDPAVMFRFWMVQRSFFNIKHQLHGSSASEDVSQLISYENENGWAIIVKGPTVIFVGGGDLILKAMEEFQAWKKNLRWEGFSASFKDYYHELTAKSPHCTHVNILGFSGWIPLIIVCPMCHRYMGSGIRFTCCHGGPDVL